MDGEKSLACWVEYNIHLRSTSMNDAISVLVDFVHPFMRNHGEYVNWHYLVEQNSCGSTQLEIRLRVEGAKEYIDTFRRDMTVEIQNYSQRTNLVMSENDALGSHEGLHGSRTGHYQGAASENFGRDWNSIVRIMQIGSENAIEIFRLAQGLVERRSFDDGPRQVNHPYYLHLTFNQLLTE